MGVLSKATRSAVDASRRCAAWTVTQTHRLLKATKGQGTTEYAILVGVLVVIAIIAVAAFRGKVQELWDAIKDNMATL